MFMDLKHPLVKGQSVGVTLTFEHAGSIPVDFSVNASDSAPGAKGMDMKGTKM
jgi:copper(I)-binding protein